MYFITIDAKNRRRAVLTLSLALLLLVMYLGSPSPAEDAAPVSGEQRPVDHIDISEKRAALTFNVCWGTETVTAVLETLDSHNVRATFFLAGPWSETHQEQIELIKQQGHEIGILGYRQINLTELEMQEISKEIKKAVQAHYDLTGENPVFFRPPNGQWDDRVLTAASDHELVTVTHSLDAKDWANPGVEKITSNVIDGISGGDIVQFYADDSSTQLAQALPEIIKGLNQKGFHCVTLSRLLEIE